MKYGSDSFGNKTGKIYLLQISAGLGVVKTRAIQKGEQN